MSLSKTFYALKQHISELHKRHVLPTEEDAFSYWVCQATIANPDDDEAIKRSLVGVLGNDRNVDIASISHMSQAVFICQTKYRKSLNKPHEKGNDVHGPAKIAEDLRLTRSEFLGTFEHSNVDVIKSMGLVWDAVRMQGYSVRLMYVTTGSISPDIQKAVQARVSGIILPDASRLDCYFLAYSGADCCRLFVDYQDLVPAIPYVDFTGVRHQLDFEDAHDTRCIVFAANATNLKDIYLSYGEKLFARNVRLSKGDKTIPNTEIQKTLEAYPGEFFYLNNGITVLGSKAEIVDNRAVRVFSPQIINGQQTTRTIAKRARVSSDSKVLVKLIARGPRRDEDFDQLRKFIYRVVRAANTQNPISISELAANNREHINLERALKDRGWQYIRKTGTKELDESRYWSGALRPWGKITLQRLTTALVVCRYDPQYIRRVGVEKMFESVFTEENDEVYWRLFSDRNPITDYLFCILCLDLAARRDTKARTLERTIENYGTYYIAYQMHELLLSLFKGKRESLLASLGAKTRAIRYSAEIWRLRRYAGQAWTRFVKQGLSGRLDVPQFVSREATKVAWDKYWHSPANSTVRANARKFLRRLARTLPSS